MQSTIYVKLAGGASVDDLRHTLEQRYESERFVKVLAKGVVPHTRHVRGTNFCLVSYLKVDVRVHRACTLQGGFADACGHCSYAAAAIGKKCICRRCIASMLRASKRHKQWQCRHAVGLSSVMR